jgi:hypothetical protein
MPAILNENSKNGQVIGIWTGVATADAGTVLPMRTKGAGSLGGTVHFSSASWGGTTVALHGSIDGTTFFPMKDVDQEEISVTENASVNFSEAVVYIKPVPAGGTGVVTVSICLAG